MTWIELLFWIFVFIVFYSYIGYGILLWLLLKVKSFFKKEKNNQQGIDFYPVVTLIIPAFNEEDFITQKIRNTLSLDYPKDKLKVVFVTDGSTDNTPKIISEHSGLILMHNHERKGKIAAMNRAMKEVNTPFVIFCDANTLLNDAAIKKIIRHYTDLKIGGVAGEKKVVAADGNNMAGVGEGFYWKYESLLKKLDSDFYTVVGAAGELFSFRTELFDEMDEDTLLDDFIISLKICQKGYRVVYEPAAYAMEKPSENMREEQKRKIRISAGGFQSIVKLKAILNFFKYPKLFFQYFSHRVLRWAVCPFLLPLILLLNILIVEKTQGLLYSVFLLCQLFFYFLALLGWILSRSKKKAGFLNFPYYFLFMNISLYLGLIRFFRKKQTVIWEKAKRKI